MIEYRDPENNVTTTLYNENLLNALNQRLLQIKTLDPQSIITLETYDALSRKIEVRKMSEGKTLSSQERSYDPNGNLTEQEEHVFENNSFRNTQKIKDLYTEEDQIKSLTKGFGSKDAKITTYAYFPSGKLEKKTLPDKVTLFYRYHPLGFLMHLESSDGQIDHQFEYNKRGHLLFALDRKQNIAIKREGGCFWQYLQRRLCKRIGRKGI